jgi:hypothetical protein
VTNFRN